MSYYIWHDTDYESRNCWIDVKQDAGHEAGHNVSIPGIRHATLHDIQHETTCDMYSAHQDNIYNTKMSLYICLSKVILGEILCEKLTE